MSHRIFLVNFTVQDAQVVAEAGYNVERGYIGKAVLSGQHELRLACFFPHPIYDYDVLFYNSQVTVGLEKDFGELKDFMKDTTSHRALNDLSTPPYLRVSFIGSASGMKTLILGGVPFLNLVKAPENVSRFVEASGTAFTIEELSKVLVGTTKSIVTVGEFVTVDSDPYPFNQVPVLLTRSGDQIIAYGQTYSARDHPQYIVLPQYKNNADVAVKILRCVEQLWPELLPDRVRRDWIKGQDLLLAEEKALDGEIQRLVDETVRVIEEKKKLRAKVSEENSFVRDILIATEDVKLDPSHRLSGVVKRALEFLEFKVVDIDATIKSAIKKEDFWVMDGDFIAITEVSGTVHQNPKIKEFNDILARVATIYRRKGELVLPAAANVSGLLVLNYDTDRHPSLRQAVYTAGEDEHIIQTAVDQNIGILSTVELNKILVAVKDDQITKAEARNLIRKPGRIGYDRNSARKKNPE